MKFSRVQVRCVLPRDERIGIGGIADHEYLYAPVGDRIQRLSMGGEDPGVGHQQVLAFHVGRARPRAYQQSVLRVPEAHLRSVREHDIMQCGKGAVVELHGHTLQRVHGGGDFDQLKYHGLIGPEKLTGGDPECQLVPDLSSGAGDGDAHRGFAGVVHLGWGLPLGSKARRF